jgi:molybdopterin converting factor small subunit
MITVRLPAILRPSGVPAEFTIRDTVTTIGQLVDVLDSQLPGLARQLEDALFNFAVNDALVVHGARQHPLMTGDTVEIVPTISGGHLQ